MPRQLNLIMNGKGGVGKSFFAVNFIQYLKDKQIEHAAIDSDNENSTLKRFHREALFLNLSKPQAIDLLFSELAKTSLIVADCRAASTDIFLEYFDELQVFEILKNLGATLTIICPVNHEADSVKQIKTIAEKLGAACRYVIVRNQALSDSFAIYDNSRIRKRLLEELGAREMTMPKLYDWLVASLNQEDLSITPALQSPMFSLMDRQRLKNWQQRFYEQIESAKELLLPSKTTTARLAESKGGDHG